MRLHRPLRASLLLAGLLAALLAAAPVADVAGAAPPQDAGEPVFPGLTRRLVEARLGDGQPVVANILRFDQADPGLELVPVLATGDVPGLATVPAMAQREGERYVAGVNGGFWLANPVGDPNGYLAIEGSLVSEAQTQGAGPRGTVAVRETGELLFDRLGTATTLSVAGADRTLPVAGVNRYDTIAGPHPDGPEPVFVYTPAFGSVDVRPVTRDGAALPVAAAVVSGLNPPPVGADAGVVAGVTTTPGSLAVPDGGIVVVAHGAAAATLAALGEGAEVAVTTTANPLRTDPAAWASLTHGLAVGPLLVAEGRPVDPAGWEHEGFAPQVHSLVRHPRSAIARTGTGEVLLVTVDGRQHEYSVGMTLPELADFLIGLGAVDALSLDGGGSSQMVTDGILRNRPCCDPQLRPVATGLFVRHSYSFDASNRLAGDDRDATAGAVAVAAHPEGAPEVLLANGSDFPDALAGGPLAAELGAPLLLTGRDSLSLETSRALDALQPETVTVLGGEAAIGPPVLDALAARGHEVRRLAGEERIATAVEVARALPARGGRVFLASSGDFPDALTAASPAGLLGAPVLLTGRDRLAPEVADLLRSQEVDEVVVAGGEAAVGAAVVEALDELGMDVLRLSGPDRFATARALNEWAETELACVPSPLPETTTAAAGPPAAAETTTAETVTAPAPGETGTARADGGPCVDRTGLLVARGDVFADALAGGPLAAARRQLLAIVPRGDVRSHPDVAAYLDARDAGLAEVTLLGGVAALSSYQHWQLDQLAR